MKSGKICYLCGSNHHIKREGTVRDKPNLDILECSDCSLVFLSTNKHIGEKHYEESGMHNGEEIAIESWLKETKADDKRRYDFVRDKIINKKVLDFGCGAGGFIEMARASASEVSGLELEKKLQHSFIERDLNVFPDYQTALNNKVKYDLITAFHVVEHLPNPKDTLKDLSLLLEEQGELIIEVPSSDDALLSLYNCQSFQNFTYWSQHLFLFNAKTLSELVKQAGLKVNWIKHIQRYPLSNHLYWLSHGKPGGHQIWSFMNSQFNNFEYESQLASIGKTDTIIAGVMKI
ncbi:class I SAM-dependent methyltransferase [Alphaproteobacteria bacterium]|nr:class I SAM-dependent methyltransferase [Alphaproteobacteria bacterium]